VIIPPVEKYETLRKITEAALDINHPMFQVIVALRKDSPQLNKLISDFSLVKLEAVYRMILKSATVRLSYRSTKEKNLTVIVTDSDDDASVINTAIDVSSYPFICLLSEEYIPSRELLLSLEPPVISNELPNYGSVCSSAGYEGMKVSQYYIKSIYSYSNLLSLSIPSDFAILLKKKFITDKKGMRKGEKFPVFIRRMIKEGLRLRYVSETGLSSERGGIFLTFLIAHLKKIICKLKLSSLAVLINDIYYLAFITLNIMLFYNLFAKTEYGIDLIIPVILIFVITPLKDIVILLNENFVRKKTENPFIIKAIFLSLFKQFGIEQMIAAIFLVLSIKRFISSWSSK
ncbi:MAG: hypothetical protein N3B13_09470, partial [Deltaproteobacteria bacterium]|nr:hypothetical protein [Deltaproteobacteria bacterium]